jgi:hypothetical protein
MLKTTMAGLAAATLAVSPALAQDAYMSPMDFSAQTQALTSSVIDNNTLGEVARRQGGRSSGAPISGAARGNMGGFVPGARVSDARLPFASTPASQKQALDAYLARAMRSNPKAVGSIAGELRKRNISRELQGEYRKYGLNSGDAADVMAGFLMVGWEAMNGRDATPAQARGIRRQVAGNLIGNPAMRNPATRQRFGEELKITTYVLAVGMNAAKRDGQVEQYRRQLAGFYRQQTGQNIAGWRLTSAGFAR